MLKSVKSVLVVGNGWNETVKSERITGDDKDGLVIYVNYPFLGEFSKEWLEKKAELEKGHDISAGGN